MTIPVVESHQTADRVRARHLDRGQPRVTDDARRPRRPEQTRMVAAPHEQTPDAPPVALGRRREWRGNRPERRPARRRRGNTHRQRRGHRSRVWAAAPVLALDWLLVSSPEREVGSVIADPLARSRIRHVQSVFDQQARALKVR